MKRTGNLSLPRTCNLNLLSRSDVLYYWCFSIPEPMTRDVVQIAYPNPLMHKKAHHSPLRDIINLLQRPRPNLSQLVPRMLRPNYISRLQHTLHERSPTLLAASAFIPFFLLYIYIYMYMFFYGVRLVYW